MVISDELSTVLGHILQIILSRLSLPASYKDGVHGMLSRPLSSSYYKSNWFSSCTAKDLTFAGGRRSREHTEALVSDFELGVLWDQYGLVGDLVVCNHLVGPSIPPDSDCDASQPFTNDFPRADIHQLIAPDLLHQLIKGTFKDHLVSWVGKYLINTHGQARANQILDDIDKRYD
jgi:Plavaka transposase